MEVMRMLFPFLNSQSDALALTRRCCPGFGEAAAKAGSICGKAMARAMRGRRVTISKRINGR